MSVTAIKKELAPQAAPVMTAVVIMPAPRASVMERITPYLHGFAINVIPPVLTTLALLLIWQLLCDRPGATLPAPTVVWNEAKELILEPFFNLGSQDVGLGWRVLVSMERVLYGFGLAAIVGVLVGCLIGQSVWAMRGLDPVFQVMRTVPPLAWLPISLAAFRDSSPSAIFVIFITSIGPIIITFGVTSATAPLLAVAAAAKYAPQWILGSVGADPLTLRALGVPLAVLNGAQTPAGNPSPNDTSDEYVKQFQEINTKYNTGTAFDDYVLQGMNIGLMTVQGLRAAGSSPTRKKLISAMEGKGSTFASVAYSPLGYSKTSNVGHTGYYMAVMDASGDRKPFGGKVTLYTTDSGSGPVVVSTFKRPAMPARGLPSNS